MGGIAWNTRARESGGGTELMGRALERRLPAELLDRFQIHLSSPEPQEPGKIQVLWTHEDTETQDAGFLANDGWRRFRLIVFVSNWQAQRFIARFGIPWSRCQVLHNAIDPVSAGGDRFAPLPANQPVKLVYTSVPARGLTILYHAFKRLAEERDDVELDVFSSFRLYGWPDDGAYQHLFDELQRVPRVTWHGAVPNDQVRKALAQAHVHAFPSVYLETSAIALIEAMSAGLACIHPNYGALFETAAGLTLMYQYQEDPNVHVTVFHEALVQVIEMLRAGDARLLSGLAVQKSYADAHYNWDLRATQWTALLEGISGAA